MNTKPATPSSLRRTIFIIAAFIAIYFIWGATYIANKWAVQAINPFLLAGLRFSIAGAMMLVLAWLVQPVRITRNQWLHGAFAGILLFVIGNGGIVWALQYLDSGFTALLASSEPILVIVLQRTIQRKRPHWITILGIVLGMIGMIILVGQPSFYLNPQSLIALGVVMIALMAWAYISIWLPNADRPSTPFHSAAIQMLTGGLILLVIAVVNGSIFDLNLGDISNQVWGSFIFLVLGGSIIAFTSFNYLLSEVPPEKVVTNSYVNPVVALFLGWWLNNEVISPQALIATLFLFAGVFLIHKRQHS